MGLFPRGHRGRGIGGTHEWADSKYAVHGELLGQASFEGSYGFKGAVGAETRF